MKNDKMSLKNRIGFFLAVSILLVYGFFTAQSTWITPRGTLFANILTVSGFGSWSQSDTNKGLATLNYDTGASGGGDDPDVGDAATGGTSGATGKIQNYTVTGGTFGGGDAAGVLTLGAVTGCFQDNEVINFTDGETAAVNGDSGVGIANDPMNNDSTGDWTDDGANIALAFAAAEYTVTTNAATQRAWMTNLSFSEGHLYKIEIDIKDGTAAGADIETYFDDGAAQYGRIETTAAGWASIWMTFEAATTTATGKAGFRIPTSLGGNNIEIRRFSVYEIIPCSTSGTNAFDGWSKSTAMDIYRQHNDGGTYTKDGSFYSLKMVPTDSGIQVYWGNSKTINLTETLQKFAGRTVSLGVWAKTSTANHFRIRINDGGSTYSAYHPGDGAWKWIEFPKTISGAPTTFYPSFMCDAAPNIDGSTIVYVSQPMMSFASSIGEGNYQPIVQEVIWLEQYSPSNLLNNTTWSNVGPLNLNTEADSDGIISKGCKALYILTTVRDSASAANNCYLLLYGQSKVNAVIVLRNSPTGITNDMLSRSPAAWQPCYKNGDISYQVGASGANTFDITTFRYIGVQVN